MTVTLALVGAAGCHSSCCLWPLGLTAQELASPGERGWLVTSPPLGRGGQRCPVPD